MTLPAGTRLGSFQIVSMLGAGGPPSLIAASDGSSSESTVAMERTRQ